MISTYADAADVISQASIPLDEFSQLSVGPVEAAAAVTVADISNEPQIG